MNQFFQMLVGFIATVVSWIQAPAAPVAPVAPAPTPLVPKPAPDNQATLIAWMKSKEMNLGPMPGTGGVIHVDSDAMTAEIAGLVIKLSAQYASAFGLTVPQTIALMTAWIEAESRYDPTAVDPNDENLPANPTALQILDNLDLGLAQFSWRTLVALPDFKGMTVSEIKTQALDPEWAAGAMFSFCAGLIAQAKAAVMADPTLLRSMPNTNVLYLAIESYNVGPNGAVSMARAQGVKGNWAYANGIMANYAVLEPLFS